MPAAGIDFEYCAVMQTETKSFTLVNSSTSLLQFEIVADKDNTTFEIEPATGKLHPYTISPFFSKFHISIFFIVGI